MQVESRGEVGLLGGDKLQSLKHIHVSYEYASLFYLFLFKTHLVV